jgi:cell division protein FtsB
MTKHSTSTIARPAGARDQSGDLLVSAPRDDTRLIQRRRNRQLFGIVATICIVAIAGALLVLPLRDWQEQRRDLAVRQRELAALEAVNNQLQTENDRLETPGGIEEAARADYAYRSADETVIGVLPPGKVAEMPLGWPYSVVGEIFSTRLDIAAADAAAAVAATAPPTTAVPVEIEPATPPPSTVAEVTPPTTAG